MPQPNGQESRRDDDRAEKPEEPGQQSPRGDSKPDGAADERQELKRRARATRRKDAGRSGERLDWGRLWREQRLPKEAVGEVQKDDVDETDEGDLNPNLDTRQAHVEQRRPLSKNEIDESMPQMTLRRGMVIGLHSEGCRLLADGEEIEAVLRQHLYVQQQSAIAPGDTVEFHVRRGVAVVENVVERKSMLCRPDPTRPGIGRAIAANVDLAVIVASMAEPPLAPNLIDRYLIGAERGEMEPLICLNKMDLAAGWPPEMAPYEKLGIRCLGVSAVSGLNIDQLGAAIAGKLCVFVGHSGTGKSSLLNALRPGLNLKVRSVHERSGKGRHATVTANLYELDNGARVIDTPGIREFGMWRMEPDELRWYFPEFDTAPHCKFNDCTHSHEPKCGVKRAVEDGGISPQRYESYLRILKSLSQ